MIDQEISPSMDNGDHLNHKVEKRNKLKNNLSSNDERENDNYESLIECSNCGNFYRKDESKVCPVCGEKN